MRSDGVGEGEREWTRFELFPLQLDSKMAPIRASGDRRVLGQISFAFVFLAFQISPCRGGCPFQNPFWFVEKPMVVPVLDEQNSVVPNKIRLMWGRMENFKCVDYFQVEYFQRQNPPGTVQMTPRINRHRRSVEIDVVPCTEYFFKVIASEDWKGMREDFKMYSEVVGYKLEYTPRFIKPPAVTERRKGELTELDRRAQRRRERQRIQQQYNSRFGEALPADDALAPQITEAPAEFTIKVTWKLTDVDFPECLSHFVIDYYDTLYNETGFSRTIGRPFRQPQFEFEVSSVIVPCELDYEFYIRVFGLNNEHTLAYWTPPSCVVTTPAPTSTTELPEVSTVPESTTPDLSAQMADIQEENEQLQAKIDGLKQEYEKIGLQVFHAFKESFFQGLEDFLARRRTDFDGLLAGGAGGGADSGNNTEALFG